ncbi:hypothetical protein Thimo_2660 [Thioflavicoccus mobilis 8321]|uniref:Uncharacterized protein n=1 Tax=Thioflavicoccus mobilis 8321 TaxID=765912 RepID=L0H173_9GAMM|nr:hypothetical protein Thimo_2660 [Thioflavicoccus mobilis 8321]
MSNLMALKLWIKEPPIYYPGKTPGFAGVAVAV